MNCESLTTILLDNGLGLHMNRNFWEPQLLHSDCSHSVLPLAAWINHMIPTDCQFFEEDLYVLEHDISRIVKLYISRYLLEINKHNFVVIKGENEATLTLLLLEPGLPGLDILG